jgi:GDP-L-fucose synthase
MKLTVDTKIFIAGSYGMVGSAIWETLSTLGYRNLVGSSSREIDFCDNLATQIAFEKIKPDVVIMAAAKVGGIGGNHRYPVEFLQRNLRIQSNIFEAAHVQNVNRLLFLGSSCIYPKHAEQPIKESYLLTGPLEPTNEAYAIAKIAGLIEVQSYRREYGRDWISAMPTNLYGERDNFGLENSHVLPAMIRKFHDAKMNNEKAVQLWGNGSPKREFLHVKDLAAACLHLLNHYSSEDPINIGSGSDLEIKELASIIKKIVDFKGEVIWDETKPNGTPRKLLDSSKIIALGWQPKISLLSGIERTYHWFLDNQLDPNRKGGIKSE